MPKVYDLGTGTLVVSPLKTPNKAAVRSVKQRAAAEREIMRQRRAGTAMGQVTKPKSANAKKSGPKKTAKRKSSRKKEY